MPDQTESIQPVCKFDEGCHRVAPCDPGCGTPLPNQTLRDRLVAAIKASPFDELRTVDYAPNGPLLIKVKVDDLADTLMRRLPAVLPPAADRAAVLREAADGFDRHAGQLLDGVGDKAVFVAKALRDQAAVWSEAAETLRRLAAEAQQPADTDLTESDIDRLMAAGVPVQIVTAPPDTHGAEAQQQPDTEQLVCVCGAPAVQYGDRWGHEPGTGEACLYRPYARPRCPECRMPHDLTPGMARVCASILASIADRDAVERSAAADTSEETCDGCGHTPHPADQCQSFTFNERCECDEPTAAVERAATADADEETHRG